MESFGKRPKNPDFYFMKLCDGKKWFNVQQAEIAKTYLTENWLGWYIYWKDWEGERWILEYLMAWHPNSPTWLVNEREPEL